MNERLDFIIQEVQDLIGVDGASVILLDEDEKEFYFPVAAYEDKETGKRMTEIRFPSNVGVAGRVLETGKPLIVPDTSKSPYFYQQVDVQSRYRTRSMLDVPIRTPDRMVGVLCAVNKKDGPFDQTDVELLSTIAGTVAPSIENARIHEELNRSYEEVKSYNRAKDRVIHHLAHELKTPISVLSASLNLLSKKLEGTKTEGLDRILARADRNLKRLLEIQYETEDILKERDYKTAQVLEAMIDACADELEALASLETGEDALLENIRHRVREIFGPGETKPEAIDLGRFVENVLQRIRDRFSQRFCRVETHLERVSSIWIPPDVLRKIVEGLIRNAVENTPDGGLIEVSVRNGGEGPLLEVKDYGVGITEENRKLIFESNVTTYETMDYATKKPYDFNAGGKGFDLLRMKIFSERYHFKIDMDSRRCVHLPEDDDLCPGDVAGCGHCGSIDDCIESGGTNRDRAILRGRSDADGSDMKNNRIKV